MNGFFSGSMALRVLKSKAKAHAFDSFSLELKEEVYNEMKEALVQKDKFVIPVEELQCFTPYMQMDTCDNLNSQVISQEAVDEFAGSMNSVEVFPGAQLVAKSPTAFETPSKKPQKCKTEHTDRMSVKDYIAFLSSDCRHLLYKSMVVVIKSDGALEKAKMDVDHLCGKGNIYGAYEKDLVNYWKECFDGTESLIASALQEAIDLDICMKTGPSVLASTPVSSISVKSGSFCSTPSSGLRSGVRKLAISNERKKQDEESQRSNSKEVDLESWKPQEPLFQFEELKEGEVLAELAKDAADSVSHVDPLLKTLLGKVAKSLGEMDAVSDDLRSLVRTKLGFRKNVPSNETVYDYSRSRIWRQVRSICEEIGVQENEGPSMC